MAQACHPTSAWFPITAVLSHVHLCFRLENTVHRRHQRVTFLRVGFCLGHLFHPAFLIEDQSLQEGCVISRSSGWLGIAPNVRRSVVSVFLLQDTAPRP